MKNISTYKKFAIFENQDEEDEIELLRLTLDLIKDHILNFLKGRSLEADFLIVSRPNEFVMEYWPKTFDGRIPKKISYYLDELSEALSKTLKTQIDWDFSPNGNVQRIVFTVENSLDPKLIKALDRVKKSLIFIKIVIFLYL